jgi:hypothetical protein
MGRCSWRSCRAPALWERAMPATPRRRKFALREIQNLYVYCKFTNWSFFSSIIDF